MPGLRDALEEARSRYAAGRSLLAEERWDEARRTFDTAMVMLSQACVKHDVFCDFAERLAPLLQP